MTTELLRVLLLVLLGLPLAAAIVAALLGPRLRLAVRWLAAVVALVELVLALVLAANVAPRLADRPESIAADARPTFLPIVVPGDPAADTGGESHRTTWDMLPLGAAGPGRSPERTGAVQFFIGLDGLNLWLVVLTALLGAVAVAASWGRVSENEHAFYAWLLVLLTGVLGVFLSFDILLFYVFFELTLVPLFFLIGLWGGPLRREAARRFFLYTLAGSLVSLVGVVGVVWICYLKTGELTFALPRLVEIMQQAPTADPAESRELIAALQPIVFLMLAAGFVVKVPLVPFHTWQPLAYTETPTAVLVLLAGIVAKLGTYGFLRLVLPLAPDAAVNLGVPLFGTLAAIGIIYGALCAYSQHDLKRLVAYSSISHLGLCVLGLLALNVAGLAGGLLHMVNHGLYTAGLFLIVGALEARYGTRSQYDLGGLGANLKGLSVFLMVLSLAALGLPGLNGFVSELLMVAGIFNMNSDRMSGPVLAVVAIIGLVLGAWYLITMLRRVVFGPLKEPGAPALGPTLTASEWLTLAPLAVLCLWIGVRPQPFVAVMRRDVAVVAHTAELARERAASAPTAEGPQR